MSRRFYILVVILCLVLAGSTIPGCSGGESTGSKWSGLTRMMKVLPQNVREFQYWDAAASRSIYEQAEALGLDGADSSSSWWNEIDGRGYCDEEHILLYVGVGSGDALASTHTEDAESYRYKGHTVWTDQGATSVLVHGILILGHDDDLRRCLDVAAGDEASLYDNLDFRDVLDWLLESMSVSVWAPDYDEAVVAEGSASTMALEEEGRITRYTKTYVTKYNKEEDAKAAADAIRNALEQDDDTSEDDTAILDVTQEGVFLRYVEERTEVNDK